MRNPSHAALYLRSSKDRSDVSIDAQRRALTELAAARRLTVVAEYADAVESGKDDDRPGFRRLLRDMKLPDRTWTTVLMLDTSRCARRRLIAVIFERDCEKSGVRVIYKNVPADTDPITENLLKSVLQAIDEWHSLTSRQKGLAGMAENVRQGWRAGGRAPRGYRLEHVATGAVRDGEPVMKSRLVPNDDAELVARYLRLRADGIARGLAVHRADVPWPATSTHAMDWQALTYAGHTVWNVHAESGSETKRRPRSEWLIQRDTHPALITDAQAEAILAQMERSALGRRNRDTPLLLTGLLVSPEGEPWHSDGAGYYRLGKGRRVKADRLERAVLDRVGLDLSSDVTVRRILESLRSLNDDHVAGQTIAGLRTRIDTLAAKQNRLTELVAEAPDAAGPLLRKISEYEATRKELVDELATLEARKSLQEGRQRIGATDVKVAIDRMLQAILEAPDARARQALAEVVERIELEPGASRCRVHYAVTVPTGDNVASRRGIHLSPVKFSAVAELA